VPPSDPSQQPPGLLARLAVRRAWGTALAWLTGAALLAAVAAGSAWLLTPGGLGPRLPGEEELGTPAARSFQASRDHEVADGEATAQLREQAAAAEPPVYDHDEEAAEDAISRVRAAFQAGRQELAEGRRRERGAHPEGAAAVARAAFEGRLGFPLRDGEWAALLESRLGAGPEQRLASLLAHALTGMVVEDRSRLAADAERGFMVRALRGGTPQGERLVSDLALVRDLRSVREEVRREGAAPPAPAGAALRDTLIRLAQQLGRPTLSFDLAETARRQREAADRVKPVVVQVRRGQRIVAEGERIERRHLLLFRGIEAQAGALDQLGTRVGGGLLVTLLVLLLWR